MVTKRNVIRFGVGDSEGRRSSDWRLWASGSDVYLATRTLAGIWKVSFHESGQCHIKAPKARADASAPPDAYLDTWHLDFTRLPQQPFSLVIPETELREIPWGSRKQKNTIWLPAPAPGSLVEFAFMFGTTASRFDPSKGGQEVGRLDLPDGRSMLLLAAVLPVREEYRSTLEDARARSLKLAASALEGHSGPGLRMLLVVRHDSGVRSWVELAIS